uniref:hypothetical protein n=1 Tax=Rhodococcus qingshengii TaxID=334542 RepID=UPI001C4DE605|nr:hypothetical protein [Rhodococcus qingshengii]
MTAAVLMLVVALAGGALALYGDRLCNQRQEQVLDDYANGRPTAGLRVLDKGFVLELVGVAVAIVALLTFLFVGPLR